MVRVPDPQVDAGLAGARGDATGLAGHAYGHGVEEAVRRKLVAEALEAVGPSGDGRKPRGTMIDGIADV